MLGREADLRAANQRLLEPQPQSILVAAGDQRETRGGADGGIGVALKEAHPSRGDAVNIGRGKIAASVTGDVGIAEVVGKDKDDVRRPGGRLGICTDATRTGSALARSAIRPCHDVIQIDAAEPGRLCRADLTGCSLPE